MASGPQETLGLTLTADTSQWDTAFAKAAAGAKAVGNEVSSLADAFDSFIEKGPGNLGKILGDVRNQAKGVGQELTGNLFGSVGNLGKLLGEVEKKSTGIGTAIKGIASGLGTLNFAMEGLGQIAGLAQAAIDSAKFAAELDNLRKNVPSEALREMQIAAGGTVAEVDLLRFGMKALNSETKLTIDGLGVLTKAANTLGDKGFGETTELMAVFHRALETGNVSVLKRYGLQVKETGDRQKDLNAAMLAMIDTAEKGINVQPALDSVNRLQTATTDWINDMRAGIGGIVIWSIGAFDKLSSAIAGVQNIKSDAEQARRNAFLYAAEKRGFDFDELAGATSYGGVERMLADDPNFQAELKRQLGLFSSKRISSAVLQQNDLMLMKVRAATGQLATAPAGSEDVLEITQDMIDRANGSGRGRRASPLRDSGIGDRVQSYFDLFGRGVGGAYSAGATAFGDFQSGGQGLGMLAFEGAASQDGGLEGLAMSAIGGATTGVEEAGERAKEMQKLMADLNDSATALGGAYSVMSSGILGAVDAAIAGNEAMGRAALKRIHQEMAAEAKLHAARAIAAGAAALGALAIGQPTAAAAFGKQAAQEAAAAAAFGVGAMATGGGGGGGGGYSNPSSAAGGGGYVGGASQDAGPQTRVYNIYGAVTSGDYQKLATTLEKANDAGRTSGRTRDTETLTVHFD